MKKILCWLVVVLCTVFFAQVPVFVDQYLMRLEGHLAESHHQIDAFTEAAAAGGKSLDQYISKFLEQSDADFLAQGKLMRIAVDRNNFLASACTALQSANPIFRPVVFVRYLDREILTDTWDGFEPGLLISTNLAVWSLIGFVFGWLLLSSIIGFWNVLRGR
jgi:hypothetical protein